METPSSTRRMTRSQTLAASNNPQNGVSALKKSEESDVTKSRQRNNGKAQYDRSPLIDITNDSPIVGLAMGSLGTPSSAAMSKKRFSSRTKYDWTPGSGEALLRGQVKTLLQKVEEEAELSKLTFENRPSLQIQGFVQSPSAFAAPTPANTPQVLNLSVNGMDHPAQTRPVEDDFVISKGNNHQEGNDSDKNLMITRSLLLDFSEKSSEGTLSSPSECLSEVTSQGTEGKAGSSVTTTEDDDASIWSIQVNASTKDDQEDDEEEGLDEAEEESCDNDYYYEEGDYEEKEDESGIVDDLCEAISQINVNGEGGNMAKFAGKHIRFVYNSDDELEEEVEDSSVKAEPNSDDELEGEVEDSSVKAEPSALILKGLPTPKGKHLRFPDEED
ncbi:OLC1v1011039C2 [Oldenlandia corymbosa var. corymbosa]|uniref:OLC1v1011039C2 n=2 Tax=Oldenlandia corymbosa var. corymbosa TaxID=529605 RepID=A0AAV1DUF2_OLDCO|nr:OLC1v1011039C2 [Oldenlandia corymbosa var. corymbosa]